MNLKQPAGCTGSLCGASCFFPCGAGAEIWAQRREEPDSVSGSLLCAASCEQDAVTPCFWSCLVRDWDVQTSPITEMSKQVFENLWSCTRQPRSFKQQCPGWEFRQFVVWIPSEFFLVFFRGNTNEPQSKVKNLMLHLLARHVPWLKRDKLVFVSFLCKEELEWDLKPNVKTAFAEKVHWSQNAIQNSRGH